MSDEDRKLNKPCTGTVPKIKHRNNMFSSPVNEDRLRSATNNLAGYWQHSFYPAQFIRNSKRNQRNNYFIMDTALEESASSSVPNGIPNFNMNAHNSSQITSSPPSRRNSSNAALKCDNVAKYPDKKQIEDKLHQIQEYLKVTNSLMTNIKNVDEPIDEDELKSLDKMTKDLKDSEAKLIEILSQVNNCETDDSENQVVENGEDNLPEHFSSCQRKNDSEANLESRNDVDLIKEQQITLMQLQRQTEKKLRNAKQLHSNLLNSQYGNDYSNSLNLKDSNNYSYFDKAIKELEERAKQLRPIPSNQHNDHDNLLAKVESLENQILSMHTANDEREELIQILDNRDADLRSQHAELQTKLVELHNKKMQVDELVAQLQTFNEEDEEDVGGQVRKIITMKDQLKKLKDMLEIVKTTENLMQNSNDSLEAQAAALDICTTTENYLEKESQKLQTKLKSENNILRYDNDTSNDSIPKQINRNPGNQSSRVVNSKIQSSISQKLALQSELESKKRELEEIMGKHKASSSNLNHDVGMDNKSEFSCTANSLNETWLPLTPHHQEDSDRFSSDDCQDEVNGYPEVNENHNILTLSNTSKSRTESLIRSDYIQHPEFERSHGLSCAQERNVRSRSADSSGCVRDQFQTNTDQKTRIQVEKQLQLIKSVCDSMLEQQSNYTPSNTNVQQLRNNLTPSPMYSERRRYANPNTSSNNTVNAANPNVDTPWFPFSNAHNNFSNEMNNYNGWLATNTIQTQSFMLNTLNQCCQMLWLQQRELVSLRFTVSMLQEKIENQFPAPQDQLPSLQTPQERSNQYHPTQKPNHVSSAFSLPNLNQYNTVPTSNIDPNFTTLNNSLHHSRILDPCLNNININHLNAAQSIEHANNALHDVNTNITPNQIWNGQALNNQVAPGNRANNYWDNFRSYSRQNLLSTKNSDPHSSIDRPSATPERTNPFTLMSFSKSNSEQGSTSTSQENTPQRQSSDRHENVIPPPDVLNVNYNTTKDNEHLNVSQHDNTEDINLGVQMLLNLNVYNDNSSNQSNTSEERILKECISERRNEWNDDTEQELLSDDQLPRTKLCEELRENVYKEVVSLISANESRPHFLIQLFRDLQMIGSDSLRLKILQSIQMIIAHSVLYSNNPKKLSSGPRLTSSEQDLSQTSDNFSCQPPFWSKPSKNCTNVPKVNVLENIQNGDLAEADQTRALDEDLEEEEGAVGGILDAALIAESNSVTATCDEIEMTFERSLCNSEDVCEDIDISFNDLPCNAEGLDQIPTRLPTKVKSRSATPSKDRSCSRSAI